MSLPPSGVPGVDARTAGIAGRPGVDPEVIETSRVESDMSVNDLSVSAMIAGLRRRRSIGCHVNAGEPCTTVYTADNL